MGSSSVKQKLLDRVEKDRDELIHFLRGFIRTRSPNPPGDTKEAADYVTKYLDAKGISYEIAGLDPDKPNIVSIFKTKNQGKSLILNGHMDVFPVRSENGWKNSPWGGEVLMGGFTGVALVT